MTRKQNPTIKTNRKQNDWIYLTGYALVLFRTFIDSTTFHWIFPSLLGLIMRLGGYALILTQVLIERKVKIRYFYIGIIMLMISFLSLFKGGYSVLLDYAICCVFAVNVDFRRITIVYVVETITLTIITIVASLTGIIENYIYFRATGEIRLSLGFIYPTNFAAHVFFTMVGIAFLSYSKFSWKHLAVYGAVAYVMYLLTNARGPSSMIAVLAVVVLLYKVLREKGFKAIPDWFLKYSTVICAVLTLLMIRFYNANNAFWEVVNAFTTNRLTYAKRSMQQNPITLLGQFIEQRGDGNGGRLHGEAYTYIDLSFQRILLMYGLLLFIFILVYSVLLYKKSAKRRNITIPLLLFIIAFYSLTAQHYFDFSYNFILLSYFANIPDDGIAERFKRIRRVGVFK